MPYLHGLVRARSFASMSSGLSTSVGTLDRNFPSQSEMPKWRENNIHTYCFLILRIAFRPKFGPSTCVARHVALASDICAF